MIHKLLLMKGCLLQTLWQFQVCSITSILIVFWTVSHYRSVFKLIITRSLAARFGRHCMTPPTSNHDLWPFDLENGMRVASKVGNLLSKFGNARPLGSRINCYVCDRRTDGRTKAMLVATCGWGIIVLTVIIVIISFVEWMLQRYHR